MRHFKDNHVLYRDGSLGGFAPLSTLGSLNSSSSMRQLIGYGKGQRDAEMIINSLSRDKNGNITESIKVITHSMGSAYAKGNLKALQECVKKNNIQGVSIIEADFAAFQPGEQSAVDGIPTFQFANDNDDVANNEMLGSTFAKIDGAKSVTTDSDKDKGHSIFDFMDKIKDLPAGKYKVVNGEVVPE